MAMPTSSLSRLFGAILLIAGTSIGAAMLALPVTTGRSGLIPSLCVMLFVWAYLCYAALCLLEVNLSMPRGTCNLISMATATLGTPGKLFSWAAYLFLLYALNTAYLSGLTSLFQDFMARELGLHMSIFVSMLPILAIFALLLRGGVQRIDYINRLFMFGLIATFSVLVVLALPHVQPSHLTTVHLEYMAASLAIVLCAFGYHVVIPTVVTYLDGNVKELKKAIWIGSALPLVAYSIWQTATLGLVPESGIQQAYLDGLSGAQLLADVTESSWISGLDQSFAFFAIITSFLGVSMSLFHFLSDGLQQKGVKLASGVIFCLCFGPPVYFALTNKRIFLVALEYAGAFGVVLLLALLPALMVWRKRYVLERSSPYQAPGGRLVLAGFIALSLCLIAFEVVRVVERST